MDRDPTADACLLNSDVDHVADVIANLKARLDAAERSKLEMATALIIAAGGRIEVTPKHLQGLPEYEVQQFEFVQAGVTVFEARRRDKQADDFIAIKRLDGPAQD